MSARIALVVFAVALGFLVAGGKTQGNTRDEGYYFDAAELQWSWYGDLLDNTLHGAPQKSSMQGLANADFNPQGETP